jgi:hypothetical protein
MSGFHEVRFPDNIAYGATGGPEFATTVVATRSGHEKRNVNWAQARGRWDFASGLKKQAQIEELIAFFRARRGRAYRLRLSPDFIGQKRLEPPVSLRRVSVRAAAVHPRTLTGTPNSPESQAAEMHWLQQNALTLPQFLRPGRTPRSSASSQVAHHTGAWPPPG